MLQSRLHLHARGPFQTEGKYVSRQLAAAGSIAHIACLAGCLKRAFRAQST